MWTGPTCQSAPRFASSCDPRLARGAVAAAVGPCRGPRTTDGWWRHPPPWRCWVS